MKSFAIALFFGSFVLTTANPATAGPLTGVTGTSILVESLDDDARKCNVAEDSLEAAVRLPLRAANVPVQPNGNDHYIYVNVTVLALSNGLCVATVVVNGNRTLWRKDDYTGGYEPIYGASGWHKGSTLTGSSGDFGRRVAGVVEDFTKMWISQWLKDN